LGYYSGKSKMMISAISSRKMANPLESYKFPIHYVKNILLIYYYCIPYYNSNFKEKVFAELKEVFFDRVERLNLRDLKDNDINIVFNVIRDAAGLFETLNGKDATQMNEWSELECAWNILNSSILEKRIKVMGEFSQFITRCQSDIESRNGVEKRRFRFVNNEKLKNWLLNKKILDFILGDQFHVEIFKRAGPILKFLANQNALSTEHIDKIWKVTSSTQEEDVRSAYKLFVELATDAPTEVRKNFPCKMLDSRPYVFSN
jgi:ubiquitin carboxyl-terminal hydrolase 9/24